MRELKRNEINKVSAGLRSRDFQYYTPEGPSHEPPIFVGVSRFSLDRRFLPVGPRPVIDI